MNPVEQAYQILVKAYNSGDINDLPGAVEEAIGYLGQALE